VMSKRGYYSSRLFCMRTVSMRARVCARRVCACTRMRACVRMCARGCIRSLKYRSPSTELGCLLSETPKVLDGRLVRINR
jgi:hypothetical protein